MLHYTIKCFAEHSLIRLQRLNPEQLGQIWTQYSNLILSEFGLLSNFWHNVGDWHKYQDLTYLLRNTVQLKISSWNFIKILKKKLNPLKKLELPKIFWIPPWSNYPTLLSLPFLCNFKAIELLIHKLLSWR